MTLRQVQSVGILAAAGILVHPQANLILDYATFLVAVVTAVFGVFVAGFGLVEWKRFRELKRDLDAQRSELARERLTLEARVENFKAELKTQEQRLAANQRFLEAVLAHHSDLLVGIIDGFGSALNPGEAQRLRSLISEAEAALDLFHPDKGEVLKALLRLEQIGADNAVPSLVRLRDDNAAEKEVSVRAQQVLSRILERLRRPETASETRSVAGPAGSLDLDSSLTVAGDSDVVHQS